jgi:hypothetical protein
MKVAVSWATIRVSAYVLFNCGDACRPRRDKMDFTHRSNGREQRKFAGAGRLDRHGWNN